MISHNGAQAEEKLQYSSSVNISYETPLASYLIFTVQEQWKQTFECQTHIQAVGAVVQVWECSIYGEQLVSN